MRTGRSLVVLSIVLAAGTADLVSGGVQRPSTPTSASGALQHGLTLMETRGDCVAALPHLERAARDGDTAVAPRALAASAECLERLARQDDARRTWERLASNFPRHALAGRARQRLARLAPSTRPASDGITLRRLEVRNASMFGTLSADGRLYAHRDDDAVPWRVALASGRAERLTLGPPDEDTFAIMPLVLSPDGRQVAHTWPGPDSTQLRIHDTSSATHRVLATFPADTLVRPLAWAPAGSVLFLATTPDYRVTMQLADVGSGAVTVLRDLGVVEPFNAVLSPDAHWVAFDHAADGGPRDVWVLDTRARAVAPLVEHVANDVLPVYTPDGRHVLFASDRLGPLSLWRQTIANGRPQGEPMLLRRNIGRMWPIGVTPNGAFIHGVQSGLTDVHIAALDAEGRAADTTPVETAFSGANQTPDWSPDGRILAYVSQRGATVLGPGSRALVLRDRASGEERLVWPNMLTFVGPRWSHDGTRVLIKGRSTANRWGMFTVDVATGAVSDAVLASDVDTETSLGAYQWSPGRNALLFARHGVGIVEFDFTSKSERTIVTLPPDVYVTPGRGCAWAPDGQTLAYSVQEGRGRDSRIVLYLRLPDGTTHELSRVAMPEGMMLQGWAPDARGVYVLRRLVTSSSTPPRDELWRIPTDGGAPVFTGIAAPGLRNVAIHPDGRSVAYVAGYPDWDLWSLEHPALR